EEAPQPARYTIETSDDGAHWTVLETVEREGANAYFEFADGIAARRVRVVGQAMPYGQPMRISGLRVFGLGHGEPPTPAQ
ncbi:discoidin domain-containing protein, partial [Ruthenibacterium lactatiformans]|uniref:discoidin domain-containing protein n=2 Tax=Oscillospiraceae TaxID=216572 RepID=UPI0022E1BE46